MTEATRVRERPLGRARLIEVRGDLDVSNADRFVDLLFSAVEASNARVVLDLRQTAFIDSTVLNALFACGRKLRQTGGALAIICTSTHLRRVLEASGLDAAYPIVEGPDAALEELAASD